MVRGLDRSSFSWQCLRYVPGARTLLTGAPTKTSVTPLSDKPLADQPQAEAGSGVAGRHGTVITHLFPFGVRTNARRTLSRRSRHQQVQQ
jgi:hypothetical protein